MRRQSKGSGRQRKSAGGKGTGRRQSAARAASLSANGRVMETEGKMSPRKNKQRRGAATTRKWYSGRWGGVQ
eukprot:217422-Hanusia_phi.AAC.1